MCSVGNSSAQLPIAIIGGGITGLTAAYHLARQDRPFRLFEAAPRVGGNIRSERHDGWLLEAGPNSLQLTPPVATLFTELAQAAGLNVVSQFVFWDQQNKIGVPRLGDRITRLAKP